MRRIAEVCFELLAWALIAGLVLTSPFACVYGCRAAWTAGGRV